MDVLADDRQRITCREGQFSGGEFIQHHTQRVQIRAGIDRLPLGLLGGQVEDCPDDGALAGQA